MWESHANAVIAPLHNLPPLPWINFRERMFAHPLGEHYKLGPIKDFVKDRPFAWVDDDIDNSVIKWANNRNRKAPTLVVSINPNLGFNADTFETLQRFGKGVRGATHGKESYGG